MTVGERIKTSRVKRGITQKELAKKLEVSETFISQYERGVRNPKLETIQKIADALNVPLDELLGLDMGNVEFYESAPEELKKAWNKFHEVTRESFLNMKYTPKARIEEAFDSMNEKGQQKAVEQVEDLAKVPEYQKKKPDEQTETKEPGMSLSSALSKFENEKP